MWASPDRRPAAALRTLPAGRTDVRSDSGLPTSFARLPPPAPSGARHSAPQNPGRPRVPTSAHAPEVLRLAPNLFTAPIPSTARGRCARERGAPTAGSALRPGLRARRGHRLAPGHALTCPAGPRREHPSWGKAWGCGHCGGPGAPASGRHWGTAPGGSVAGPRSGVDTAWPGTRSAGAPPCPHQPRPPALRGGLLGKVFWQVLCQDLQTSYRSRDGAPGGYPASSHGDEDTEEQSPPTPPAPVCSHPAPPLQPCERGTCPPASSQEAAGPHCPASTSAGDVAEPGRGAQGPPGSCGASPGGRQGHSP